MSVSRGISRDKTMDNKFMRIPNDKKKHSLYKLKLLVEKFGNCQCWTNQSRFDAGIQILLYFIKL